MTPVDLFHSVIRNKAKTQFRFKYYFVKLENIVVFIVAVNHCGSLQWTECSWILICCDGESEI